jgi:DNA polymerase-1
MGEENTVYLIDGSAYMYRAFHAVRNLSNSSGMPTNAVYGFTRMLMKLINERSPAYAAMCFDAKGPTFRHEMYADYKANRPPMPEDMAVQIPFIKDVTRAFQVPVFEQKGVEADDIIGTLARLAERAGFEVIMVTGDKDFVQLVTEKTILWDPMKEKTRDLAAVREEYGMDPERIIDVMGLSGDTSDNVPGVPGIGPKTALSLIQTFGSIEGLYENLHQIAKKKKQHENLTTYRDQAFLSRELVTIDCELPMAFDPDQLKTRPPDETALLALFKELEFSGLQQAFSQPEPKREKTYQAVCKAGALKDLAGRIAEAGEFAVDTETTDIDPMRARLVGISVAVTPDEAYYIPCGHSPDAAPEQISLERVLEILGPVLENPDIHKVGQNIKYDWIVLKRHGVNLQGVTADTMLASYLINPAKRAHGLDQIALDLLNHRMISFAEVAGKGKSAVTFDRVPLETATDYAAEDADITLSAWRLLSPKLSEAGLTDLFKEVEMPLVPVLMRMEQTGIEVDRGRLRELSDTFSDQMQEIESRIYGLAGETFNINSSQQLGSILFEKLGLPVQKKTKKKTGYSTDVDVLTTLADRHELPALVLRYRSLSKLKSTYADALLELIHPETGRIHTSFNQTVTATGRLSSSDPNLQNIPIRTEEGRQIRSAFIPKQGWELMSADYSQIELRLLAHYSDDPILIQAFREGEDIHMRTATEVFQTFPSFITDELRRQAKAINFGIIYGMSAFGLSKQLGISQKMAQQYIDNYFARYKGVKEFMDSAIETARASKQTSTLLGRIRPLPDITASNRTVRQFAERTAINTPLQGTAADLIKIAMIRVEKALSGKKFKTAMLLTVHDELVFEVPPEEKEAVSSLVRETMEGVWDLRIPLKVNMAWGKTWEEAH